MEPPPLTPSHEPHSGATKGEPGIPLARLDPYLLGLFLVGAAGFLLQTLVTRWGIGLSPDSATYIAGARGLLQGHGYAFPYGGGDWQPTTLWPPFYSVVLGAPGLMGVDTLASARWVNALLFGANAILVGLLIRRASGRRSIVPLMGAILFLLLDDTLSIHGWAWSEPLSLFTGFLGLLFLDRHLHTGKNGDLVLAAVFIGFSSLTRYAGLAFVACGLVVVAAFYARRRMMTAGIRSLALFGGVAMIGIVAWAIRNWLLTGLAGGGQLSSRPISPEDWKASLDIVSLWLIPGRIEEPLQGAIFSGIGVAVTLLILPAVRDRTASGLPASPNSIVPILLVFLPLYSLVILGSKAYVRPLELDDPRHYVPVYAALLVVILVQIRSFTLASLTHLARQHRPQLRVAVQAFAAILFVILVAYHGTHAWKWARESFSEGLGYANESWHTSRLLAYVRDLPPNVPVFSNAYDAVYVLTGREVYPVPGGIALTTSGVQARDLPGEWLRMEQLLKDEAGVIAYFRESTRRGMTDEATLRDVLPICLLLEAPEGKAFGWCAQN